MSKTTPKYQVINANKSLEKSNFRFIPKEIMLYMVRFLTPLQIIQLKTASKYFYDLLQFRDKVKEFTNSRVFISCPSLEDGIGVIALRTTCYEFLKTCNSEQEFLKFLDKGIPVDKWLVKMLKQLNKPELADLSSELMTKYHTILSEIKECENFIEQHGVVNCRDKCNNTLLHKCLVNMSSKRCKILIASNQVNWHLENEDGKNAFYLLACRPSLVNEFISELSTVPEINQAMKLITAKLIAMKELEPFSLKRPIEANAYWIMAMTGQLSPEQVKELGIPELDEQYNTKLFNAMSKNQPIDDLPNKEVEVSICNGLGLVPNIYFTDKQMIESLLLLGADIDARSQHGNMALKSAILHKHVKAVNLLIEYGVDVNCHYDSYYDKNKTPLHYAASIKNIEILNLLLTNGAKVNEQDLNGFTPLHCAISSGNEEAVKALLKADAEPTIKNISGSTSLHHSINSCKGTVMKGNIGYKATDFLKGLQILKLLLPKMNKFKDQIDEQDSKGYTALHYAVDTSEEYRLEKGVNEYCLEMATELLKAGADPRVKNHNGKTALDMVKENNPKSDLLQLLQKRVDELNKRGEMTVIKRY